MQMQWQQRDQRQKEQKNNNGIAIIKLSELQHVHLIWHNTESCNNTGDDADKNKADETRTKPDNDNIPITTESEHNDTNIHHT